MKKINSVCHYSILNNSQETERGFDCSNNNVDKANSVHLLKKKEKKKLALMYITRIFSNTNMKIRFCLRGGGKACTNTTASMFFLFLSHASIVLLKKKRRRTAETTQYK